MEKPNFEIPVQAECDPNCPFLSDKCVQNKDYEAMYELAQAAASSDPDNERTALMGRFEVRLAEGNEYAALMAQLACGGMDHISLGERVLNRLHITKPRESLACKSRRVNPITNRYTGRPL